jgi:hypothetical protein
LDKTAFLRVFWAKNRRGEISHISIYYQGWVAQVWIFRPGKLGFPGTENIPKE